MIISTINVIYKIIFLNWKHKKISGFINTFMGTMNNTSSYFVTKYVLNMARGPIVFVKSRRFLPDFWAS